MAIVSLDQLQFDNRLVNQHPADPLEDASSRQVEGAVYSHIKPRRASAPQLLAYAADVAELLGIPESLCQGEDFAQVFVGNRLLPGMVPHACCYGGHQFGHWAGQLGDGRAINLGELRNNRGEHWTLQLKGAGRTPYSRTADGLAVLRSSLREFLCSEAMHHLGVPTTRALSLVSTGDKVLRDMFYDGHPQMEPGAVVCRVAPNFTRFGNFEIFSARGELSLLKQLTDFTIRCDFPELVPSSGQLDGECYSAWFAEVCRRTAQLMAHWMRVGFVHGVMNTDNMSILGLTIDYGPYGWLEGYDLNWTPNTTDAQGRRYRYGNQPRIALWNLAQLGNAIYPLINSAAPLEAALKLYQQEFAACSQRDMANKLGLSHFEPELDLPWVEELHQLLQQQETDMTIFYRLLAKLDAAEVEVQDDAQLLQIIAPAFYTEPDVAAAAAMAQWLRRYGVRLQQDVVLQGSDEVQKRARMNAANPKYVLRNYLAQQAIDEAEQGDYSELTRLLQLLRKPYDEQPEQEVYFAKRPEWARVKAGCSMLSCSS